MTFFSLLYSNLPSFRCKMYFKILCFSWGYNYNIFFLLLTSNTDSQALMVLLNMCTGDLQLYFLPEKTWALYILLFLSSTYSLTFLHNIYCRPFLILCSNPLYTPFSFPLIIYFRPFTLFFTIDISPNHSLINISLSPYHLLKTFPLIL